MSSSLDSSLSNPQKLTFGISFSLMLRPAKAFDYLPQITCSAIESSGFFADLYDEKGIE